MALDGLGLSIAAAASLPHVSVVSAAPHGIPAQRRPGPSAGPVAVTRTGEIDPGTVLHRAPDGAAPQGASDPRLVVISLYLTMRPIATALAMSMKKAETSGRMMKAWAQAPCSLVTAVMLAMAVGVAPRLMPVKPAEITAAW